jgi:peroxiredoxin Q/BCP
MGVERSTFLISPKGDVVKEWRKVSPKGHAQEVFDELLQIKSSK